MSDNYGSSDRGWSGIPVGALRGETRMNYPPLIRTDYFRQVSGRIEESENTFGVGYSPSEKEEEPGENRRSSPEKGGEEEGILRIPSRGKALGEDWEGGPLARGIPGSVPVETDRFPGPLPGREERESPERFEGGGE